MNKTRIFLDVDGVINAQMPMGWGRLQNGHAKADGIEFRIRWAPNMVKGLFGMDAEIIWSTTWRQDAVNSLAPLIGYGADCDVLHPIFGETIFPSIDWKYPAILDYLHRNPGPAIWLDDEIEPEMVEYFSDRGWLAIPINSMIGISTVNAVTIDNYIKAHS